MKFTYQELQNKVGDKVGVYRGHPVYSVNVHTYINLNEHSDAYLVYDDDNTLVVGELAIGRIKENGAIDYFRISLDYNNCLEARGFLEKQLVKIEVAPSTSMFETSEVSTNIPSPIDLDVSKLTVDLDLSSSELVESLLNSVFEG